MAAKSPTRDGLTVGELAERSGVRVSTIHFYEGKGLIKGWRSEGNQRRFPREALRRVAVIKVAQRAGVPLSKVKEALSELPADEAPTRDDWFRLSARWRADLEQRIRRLTKLRDDLDGCIGCGCLSTSHCPLRNPNDELATQGPGPRLLDPPD
jgi:MerR family redox-sensitive transcriptional activator SoxR